MSAVSAVDADAPYFRNGWLSLPLEVPIANFAGRRQSPRKSSEKQQFGNALIPNFGTCHFKNLSRIPWIWNFIPRMMRRHAPAMLTNSHANLTLSPLVEMSPCPSVQTCCKTSWILRWFCEDSVELGVLRKQHGQCSLERFKFSFSEIGCNPPPCTRLYYCNAVSYVQNMSKHSDREITC